jgi:hypothetical protein
VERFQFWLSIHIPRDLAHIKRMTLEEAEGYMELQMLEEAWSAIDDLPPEERYHPRAVRVRMYSAFGLKRFHMAEALALHLASPESDHKADASMVLHQLATIHARAGNGEKARELIKFSIQADPDRRLKILDDPELPEDFI